MEVGTEGKKGGGRDGGEEGWWDRGGAGYRRGTAAWGKVNSFEEKNLEKSAIAALRLKLRLVSIHRPHSNL